jgi:hypothetical protein
MQWQPTSSTQLTGTIAEYVAAKPIAAIAALAFCGNVISHKA